MSAAGDRGGANSCKRRKAHGIDGSNVLSAGLGLTPTVRGGDPSGAGDELTDDGVEVGDLAVQGGGEGVGAGRLQEAF